MKTKDVAIAHITMYIHNIAELNYHQMYIHTYQLLHWLSRFAKFHVLSNEVLLCLCEHQGWRCPVLDSGPSVGGRRIGSWPAHYLIAPFTGPTLQQRRRGVHIVTWSPWLNLQYTYKLMKSKGKAI